MNNKITNPKTEVPKGMVLNDKDYLNMTLSLLKDMEKNYAISLTEVSNENLFAKYEETFNVIKSLQREVFELAFRKGSYFNINLSLSTSIVMVLPKDILSLMIASAIRVSTFL